MAQPEQNITFNVQPKKPHITAIWMLAIALLLSLFGNWYFISLNREANGRAISANRQSQERVAQKQAEILSRDSVIKAIREKVGEDSLKFLSDSRALKQANSSLTRRINQLRPIITPDLAENDTLKAFVDLTDSLLATKDSLLYRQEIFCTAQTRNLREIIALTNQQYESQKLITSEVTSQLAEVDAQMRKERKKKRFWQVVGGVLAAGIIYQSMTK